MYISNSMIHSFNDIAKVFIGDNRNSEITNVIVRTNSSLKPIYEYNYAGSTGTIEIYEDPKYKDAFFNVISTRLCAYNDLSNYHVILTVSIRETDHDQVNIPDYYSFYNIYDIVRWMREDFNGGRVKIVNRKTKEIITTIEYSDTNNDDRIDAISYLVGQFDVMEIDIDTGLNAKFYVNRNCSSDEDKEYCIHESTEKAKI